MAFCKQCGSQLDDGVKFCQKCGAPTEENATQGQAQSQNKSNGFDAILNTPDKTAEFDAADINGNKVMAVLSYFGILVLIPILAAKNSKYARYHANQGLVLLIAEVVISVASAIVTSFLGGIVVLGTVLSLAFTLLDLATLALAVIGIVNAAQGKAKELPVIGGLFTILQ